MTPDITTRLRQTRANMIGTDDEDHYFDCHEAAGEIERLRLWVRLTDEEREAVERGIDSLVGVEDTGPSSTLDDDAAACILRSLLTRFNAGSDQR